MRTKERLPRKRYSPEFKMELVRLALEQDVTNGAIVVLPQPGWKKMDETFWRTRI
ncbi:hypothetical protein [Escherichia coli]|uniref:hypothetical protein n=1 Tax=Escherichia coli TaxID=562 RepID=UPI001621EDFA|nr:hypothetical protein [Escherichia coli]